MKKELLNSMFENLLHIGNKKNFWNSKMKNYIYGSVNGIHVINLVKTGEKLEEVKKELNLLASEGKKILFVATKLQARDSFSKLASETGHYYVTEKWVPGLLTNFKTIKGRIATYIKLLKDSETGGFDLLTKKEKAAQLLDLEKLDRAFKGLKDMKKMPDAILVVDSVYEEQAVKEANNLNIIVYAIASTNGDDTVVKNLIPANTNSVKSLDFLANSIAEAFVGVTVKKSDIQKTLTRTPVKTKPTINKTIVKEVSSINTEAKLTKKYIEIKSIKEDTEVKSIKEDTEAKLTKKDIEIKSIKEDTEAKSEEK